MVGGKRMSKLKKYNKLKLLIVFIIFVVGLICGKKAVNLLNKKINDIETSIIKYTIDDNVYGMPYINPAWEEYMNLSDEDKNQVTDVPSMYIYDYIPEDDMFGDYDSIPSQFNLRDDYATTLYNQGNEGLCWAYTTATMLESNLKVTKGLDKQFSVHAFDYLTSKSEYFVNDYNPYSFNREMGTGLAYLYSHGFHSSILSSGVAPVLNEKFDVEYDGVNKLNISDVANSNNVDYTVKRTVYFPAYQNTDEYKNMLKSFIMNYGAVHVVTVSPNLYEGNVIDFQYEQYGFENLSYSGHAMAIIGWDDNAGIDKDNDGNLDGAWILQNSWNEVEYDYYYISYTSEITELFGVIEIDDKDWDTSYDMGDLPNIEYSGISIFQENEKLKMIASESAIFSKNMLLNANAISGTLFVTYNKPSFKEESLNSINFTSASQNSTYKIYVSTDGSKDNFQYIKDVNTDMPGLYTVDFNDVTLDSDKFTIKITTTDGAMYTQVNAFTSDVSSSPLGVQIDSYLDNGGFDVSGNYEYHIVSYVQGISDGETIKYFLHDENGDALYEESLYSSVINNSKAFGKIQFSRKTPLYFKGYVDVIYDESVVDTVEIVYEPFTYLGGMDGSGTFEDPYVVTNALQLSLISNSPSAYYVLGSDIDLSYDVNNPVTYNRGFGWISLDEFNGVLDGNGHSINNLYIYSKRGELRQEKEKFIGLFSKLDGATIKNLRVLDANILNGADEFNKYNIGILSGKSVDSNIQDVLVSGNINDENSKSPNNGNIGLLIGLVSNDGSFNKVTCIGSLNSGFSKYVGGVIGKSDFDVSISNLNSIVNIVVPNLSSYVGGVLGGGNLTSINSSYVFPIYSYDNLRKSSAVVDILSGNYSYPTSINNLTTIDSINVYNVNNSSFNERHSSSNVRLVSSISDMKLVSLSELGLDSDIWEYLDDNPYPTLKSLPFYFISDIDVNDINISLNNNKEIEALVTPSGASYTDLSYITSDSGIARIKDGRVYGNSIGDVTLTVSSKDGSNISKTINIHVYEGEYTLSYKYSLDVIKSSRYDEGMVVILTDNDVLQNAERYLYGWEYDNVIYRTGDSFIMPDQDIVLEAVYRLEPPSLSTYQYSNKDNLIKNICYTSIENYKNNLNVSDEYTVRVFNRNNQEMIDGNIGTGYVTKIYKGNEEVIDYVNVVPGDLDGDAGIRSRDVTRALQYIVGIRNPHPKDYSYMALDFSRDGEYRLNDARLIQAYVVQDYSFFNEVCPNE